MSRYIDAKTGTITPKSGLALGERGEKMKQYKTILDEKSMIWRDTDV